MALHMLVNGGADCGPINPLQNLTKRFDSDRGIQQDQFVTARAGPSRQNFRSLQPTGDTGAQSEANQFFQDQSRYKLGHNTLPVGPADLPIVPSSQSEQVQHHAWAAAFLRQTPSPLNTPISSKFVSEFRQDMNSVVQQGLAVQSQPPMQVTRWQGPTLRFGSSPQTYHSQTSALDPEIVAKAIQDLELNQTTTQTPETGQKMSPAEMDEFARTAALLVKSVEDDENPKFRSSSFMSLMRQIRDREIVVDGNDLKEVTGSGWASEFGIREHKDKGKGRADVAPTSFRRKSVHFESSAGAIEAQEVKNSSLVSESEIDVYLQRENEEYQLMNFEMDAAVRSSRVGDGRTLVEDTSPNSEWGHLQDDWDRFETSACGVRPAGAYNFQHNNPYLGRDFTATRHHSFHESSRFEDVLQKEAAVQKDPTNARTWYELGVKQQENEREMEAIEALQRAVGHDPTLTDAWLALAVSYTNEGQLGGAYDAIEHWISGNEDYRQIVADIKQADKEGVGTRERCNKLVDTLMTIIRSNPEVDADTQVALAVLLNTMEDYVRASDCFKAALAARPDDWLLYNRVGATLANSGNPNEAIGYYNRALELNSGYIRARYNLGISCINLQKYDEASQYILDALVLQGQDAAEGPQPLSVTRGVTSSVLWDSLKTAYLHLQRSDLASLCDERDLAGIRTALAANYI